MKQIITLLILFITFTVSAQTVVSDSVNMGTNYTTEVFYSLQNGIAGQSAIDRWDLGFQSPLEQASIIVNHNKGMTGSGVVSAINLYKVTDKDTSDWTALQDVTDINNWQLLYNSDSTWNDGAFNVTRSHTNVADYGWGNYVPYNVIGDDSFFVLQMGHAGAYTYKKIRIIEKVGATNSYIFRIANLNNTNDTTVTINVGNFQTKNFAYFNVSNDSTIDLEPANSDWDVLFTTYEDEVAPGLMYPVTGVLSNVGVQVARASGVDINTVNYQNYANSYMPNINTIGWDWANFNMTTFKYNIVDSLVYFVKTNAGAIYELRFTRFQGDTTGKIYFDKTLEQLTAVPSVNGTAFASAMVYPDPASNNCSLVYNTGKSGKTLISVYDLSGRNVLSQSISVKEGLNILPLSVNNLANGSYFLKAEQDGSSVNLKMIVSK